MVLFTFFKPVHVRCMHWLHVITILYHSLFNKLKQNSNLYIQYFAVYQSYADCPNRYGLLRTLLDLRNTTGSGSRS